MHWKMVLIVLLLSDPIAFLALFVPISMFEVVSLVAPVDVVAGYYI